MGLFKKPEPLHIFLDLSTQKIRKELTSSEIVEMPADILRDGPVVRELFASWGFDPNNPIDVLHDPIRDVYIFEQEKKR